MFPEKILGVLLLIGCSVSSFAQQWVICNVDTLRGDVRKVTNFEFNGMDTIRSVHTYDGQGLELVAYFSSRSNILGNRKTRYDKDLRIMASELYYGNDSLCERHTYKYDTRGRKIQQKTEYRHCGECNDLRDILEGTMSNWVTGEYIARTTSNNRFDDMENLVEVENHVVKNWLSNGAVQFSDTTIETKHYKYATDGEVQEVVERRIERGSREDSTLTVTHPQPAGNEGGRPQNEANKIVNHGQVIEYDAHGNLIKLTRNGAVIIRREIEYN